jgi:hypothetical protein
MTLFVLRLFVGSSEVENPKALVELQRTNRISKLLGFGIELLEKLLKAFNVNKKLRTLVDKLKACKQKIDIYLDRMSVDRQYKHRLCTHRYNCFFHSILVGIYFHDCPCVSCSVSV